VLPAVPANSKVRCSTCTSFACIILGVTGPTCHLTGSKPVPSSWPAHTQQDEGDAQHTAADLAVMAGRRVLPPTLLQEAAHQCVQLEVEHIH
jgi:hypothetical protein